MDNDCDCSAMCSEHTPEKQRNFAYFLGAYLKSTKSIIARSRLPGSSLFYIDMNSGPGAPYGQEGSPLIFIRHAQSVNIPYKAFLIEEDLRSVDSLRVYVKDNPNVHVLPGDNNLILPQCLDRIGSEYGGLSPYGLCYADPNGPIDQLPFEALAAASLRRETRVMDYLIHISATIIKRVRCNKQCAFKSDLNSMISKINKKHWVLWRPSGPFQWVFLWGTNWENPPLFKKFGCVSLKSPEGQNLIDMLSRSEPERSMSGVV